MSSTYVQSTPHRYFIASSSQFLKNIITNKTINQNVKLFLSDLQAVFDNIINKMSHGNNWINDHILQQSFPWRDFVQIQIQFDVLYTELVDRYYDIIGRLHACQSSLKYTLLCVMFASAALFRFVVIIERKCVEISVKY